MKYNTTQWYTIKYKKNTTFTAIQCNAKHSTMLYNAVYNPIESNAIQYKTKQCYTMRYNPIQYNTLLYNAIQYKKI